MRPEPLGPVAGFPSSRMRISLDFLRTCHMRKPRLLISGIFAAVFAASVAGITLDSSARSGPSATDLALINGVIELVQRAYVHPVGADELTTDALKGMLSRLDPHSDYMDEAEFKQSQSDLDGRFGGLGIQISSQ